MSNVIKTKGSIYKVLSTLPDPERDAYLGVGHPVHILTGYLNKSDA